MMWSRLEQFAKATRRDPEIWPLAVFNVAVIIYGGDVALRKIRGGDSAKRYS